MKMMEIAQAQDGTSITANFKTLINNSLRPHVEDVNHVQSVQTDSIDCHKYKGIKAIHVPLGEEGSALARAVSKKCGICTRPLRPYPPISNANDTPITLEYEMHCGENVTLELLSRLKACQVVPTVLPRHSYKENGGKCTDRNSAEVFHPLYDPFIRQRYVYVSRPNTIWANDRLRVLVISSPKTGSTGLFNAFWNDPKNVDFLLRTHEIESMYYGWIPFPGGYAKPPNGRCIVVTAYREPVSWLLSNYFEKDTRPTPGLPLLCSGPATGVNDTLEYLKHLGGSSADGYNTGQVLNAVGVQNLTFALHSAHANGGLFHLQPYNEIHGESKWRSAPIPSLSGCELLLVEIEKP